MKIQKASFFLALMLISAEAKAQEIITHGAGAISGKEFIISNLVNSRSYGEHRIGGNNPKRAVSFFTHDNRYGVQYRVRDIVLHVDEKSGGWNYNHAGLRWPSPRIFTDHETGNSHPDTRMGYFVSDEHRDYKGEPYNNERLVRQATTWRSKIYLEPHTRYWMVHNTSYAGDYNPQNDSSIFAEFYKANDNTERSPVGWTMDNREMLRMSRRHDEGSWYWPDTPSTPPIQWALYVTETHPDPFEVGDTITPGNLAWKNFIRPVHNIGTLRWERISNSTWRAAPFYTTTSKDSPPLAFRINHVTMHCTIRDQGHNYVQGTHILAIYDSGRDPDNWWRKVPGNEIGRFAQGPPEKIEGAFPGMLSFDEPEQHRFHADPDNPIIVEPYKTYWLVHRMQNASGDGWLVTSFTRLKHQDGWPIGDRYFVTTNSGNSWYQAEEFHGAQNHRTFRFGFDVSIINPLRTGDLNLDGEINVLDLILMNDHISTEHLFPTRSAWFDIGNINAPDGSTVINEDDRNLLLDLILER